MSMMQCDLKTNSLGFPDPEPLPGEDKNLHIFKMDMMHLNCIHGWWSHTADMACLTKKEFSTSGSLELSSLKNALAIVCHCWRCLHTSLQVTPRMCRKVVQTCVALHNLLCSYNGWCGPKGWWRKHFARSLKRWPWTRRPKYYRRTTCNKGGIDKVELFGQLLH